MSSGFVRKTLVLVILLLVLHAGSLSAQVSLLPEHTMTLEGVTLIRDSHKADRWYFVPERPVLLERNPKDAQNPRPVFQLVTYQAKKDSRVFEGGVLQFCVTLSLPEKTRIKLERALKEKEGTTVSLAPLPFHSAEAVLFDATGKMNTVGTQAPGLTPAYISGALPFQLKLDKFDADLYEALVNAKNSGVGVLMNLSFEGLLPPAGFKVTIDWDQTFKHLSESSETRIGIGTYNFGIDIGISKTKIREELISNGCMEVESLTNEVLTNETLDRYLDPVIEKMQQTLIAKIHPPEKIDLESRNKEDSLSKCFFFARSSVNIELRDIKQVRKGKETFIFNQSAVVERKTSCGAFIGINSYPESVKKTLVQTMTLDSWASAFLLLPGVDNAPELHINSVNMTANVVDSKGKVVSGLSDTASWSADKPLSWRNVDGDETGSLKFPLLALFDKHDNKIEAIQKEYSFKVDVIIEQKFGISGKLNTVRVSYQVPMFDGNLPLAAAVDLVDNIVFDTSLLTFSDKGLRKVKILVKKGTSGDKLEYTFSTRNKGESSVVFIVEAADKSEKVVQLLPSISFESAEVRNFPWAQNDKDLRETDPTLYFMFFDSDWGQ